jgi:NADH-quinone oxidoreductase subunit E
MAWTVKPSATTQIPKRSDPYLSAAMQAKYRAEILPRYETTMGALMPILHDVQAVHGHIPYQAVVEIAVFLKLKPADVLDTMTFYEMYHAEPIGKYLIGICQSVACEVCGHQAILDHVQNKLGIEPHETTADGKFTLHCFECLGACDAAPVALINDKLHENLTIEKLDRILDELPD